MTLRAQLPRPRAMKNQPYLEAQGSQGGLLPAFPLTSPALSTCSVIALLRATAPTLRGQGSKDTGALDRLGAGFNLGCPPQLLGPMVVHTTTL